MVILQFWCILNKYHFIKFCFNVVHLLFSGLVPPAVGCRGSKSIAAYKRALKNGKTMVLRGQVILIGATEAGKSSLLNVLHQKFNIDASLDEDELMALSETGFKFGASKYLVPSWELTESPTRPWEEWWTPSGSYMYWPTHLLKGNANTLYNLKIISWITKTHLSLFFLFWIEVTKHIFGSFQ